MDRSLKQLFLILVFVISNCAYANTLVSPTGGLTLSNNKGFAGSLGIIIHPINGEKQPGTGGAEGILLEAESGQFGSQTAIGYSHMVSYYDLVPSRPEKCCGFPPVESRSLGMCLKYVIFEDLNKKQLTGLEFEYAIFMRLIIGILVDKENNSIITIGVGY